MSRTANGWSSNGAEALEVLEAEKIDALMSDIRMPVMDGVTLVRTIYERKFAIPIILVTGYLDAGLHWTDGLGVAAIMEKPLTRKDLLLALEHSLAESSDRWLAPSA